MVENNGNGVKISSKEIYDMLLKVDKNVTILTQEFKSEFKNVNEKIEELKKENIASDEKDNKIQNQVIKIKNEVTGLNSKVSITWYLLGGIIMTLITIAFKSFT